jgi:DNA ligase-1
MKPPVPMRAVTFTEKKLVLPAYCQPKLDGVRCVTDGLRFFSRNGNEFFNTEHLQVASIARSKLWFDGELIVPGLKLGDIVSIVKREGHPDVERLEYHAFDVIDTELMFAKRLGVLRQELCRTSRWREVRTQRITHRKELTCFHTEIGERGGEGTIIRNPRGLYTAGPSNDLMKWKFVTDAEFEILDYKEGKGKDKGTPVFQCGKSQGKVRFWVRPIGSTELRKRMWKDRDDLLGCMMTVRYAGFTNDGIPFHPRGIAVRNYE